MGGTKSKVATESARAVLARRGNMIEPSAAQVNVNSAVKSRFPTERKTNISDGVTPDIPAVNIGKFSMEEVTNQNIANQVAKMPVIKTSKGSKFPEKPRERTASEVRIEEQLKLDAEEDANFSSSIPTGRLSENQLIALYSHLRETKSIDYDAISTDYSLSADQIDKLRLAAKAPQIATLSEEGVEVKLAK